MDIEDFDLIISNPPYGRSGIETTDLIQIRMKDDAEFVNMEPLNDFRLNDHTFKHIDIRTIDKEKFSTINAVINTAIYKVVKEDNGIDCYNSFFIKTVNSPLLDHYFEETNNRYHYAIDNDEFRPKIRGWLERDSKKIFYMGQRYLKDRCFPMTEDCPGWKFNHNTIGTSEVLECGAKYAQSKGKVGDFIVLEFHTSEEKNNIVDFFYSQEGRKFYKEVTGALGRDSYVRPGLYMPKVDWTKRQDLKSILRDYGYNNVDEIYIKIMGS